MNNDNLSTPNLTVPTTVGALLTEECTIDPLSHLPSFLELTFVDVARNSGRRALAAAWGLGVAWLEGATERLRRVEGVLDRVASRLSGDEGAYTSSGVRRVLRAFRVLRTQMARLRVRVLRRFCRAFLWTAKRLGPELQALIMYAIDYNCMHYLAGSTACEMVYGLKRSKIVGASSARVATTPQSLYRANNPQKAQGASQQATDVRSQRRVTELTKFEKTSSALLAALLPYCKERCDQWYSEWKEERPNHHRSSSNYHSRHSSLSGASRRTASPSIDSSKETFLRMYPYFHMLHEGSIFLYQFAYLMGYTPYWSFSLHALGVMLRRMTVADVQKQKLQQQMQSKQKGSPTPSSKSTQTSALPARDSVSSVKNIPLQTKLTVPRLLRGAVLFSISYTLLSGWYSHFQRELRLRRRRWIAGDGDDESATRESEADDGGARERIKLPIPPPPMPPNLLDGNSDHAMDKWSCPICKEPRINPTASTSGYVFCYKCLVLHLRQKGNYCPVTGMPCWENKVVRLFEPTAR